MKFKMLMFDLDGTLFDTRSSMQRAGNYALNKLGLKTFPKERYAFFSGGGIEDFVGGILDAAGDKNRRHSKEFWEYYTQEVCIPRDDDNEIYDGIIPLILLAKEKGLKRGILSNKDEKSCVAIAKEKFPPQYFDHIYGNKIGLLPKPDPGIALSMLKKENILPEECIYIGDTEIDMQTGKNAGMFTVAALWGYRDEKTLSAFRPDFSAKTPFDIMELIK